MTELPEAQRARRQRWRASLLVGILAAASRATSIPGEFVYDDISVVVDDTHLRSWSSLPDVFRTPTIHRVAVGGVFRPVSSLTWGLDALTWGRRGAELDPRPFHVTNLVLHGATSVLLYRVLLMLPGAPRALTAALLFAAHPATTEDIAWVVGRTDVLVLLFSLAAILAMELPGPIPRTLVVALFALLAYGSKENGFLLPLFLGLFLMSRPVPYRRERWLAVAVSGVLALACFAYHQRVVDVGTGFPALFAGATPPERVKLACTMLAIYARILLAPHPLTVEYYWEGDLAPPFAWIGGAALLAATLLALASRRHRGIGVWLALFVVNLSPVIHLIPSFELLAERYLYLPCVSFCVLLAMAVHAIPSPVVRGTVVAGILVGYAALSLNQSAVWLDEVALYGNAVEHAPRSALMRRNLARAHVLRGEIPRAVPHWEALLELRPEERDARLNLVRWAIETRQLEKARALLGTREAWAGDGDAEVLWDRIAAGMARTATTP